MPSSPRSDMEQIDEATRRRLQVVGDFKHGSIKRIKLVNFLTYTAVEVFPKPRLNMVVGPNGTGKSSILCAICLGLGGEPRLLGRASELETFIQNGKDHAEIELEVVNEEEDENAVIRRVIRNDGGPKSAFTWNGASISGRRVREQVTKEFQIQIDNLCTFLPQEKVGNFSGFDSRALLLETEKTLSKDSSLYHTHLELIELQQELHGGDDQVESLVAKLQTLEVESARLEGMVQKMEARQRAEEQAELLRKKILWLRHDQVHQECLELRDSKEELKQQHEEMHEAWEPLVAAHDEAKERLEKVTEEYNEFDREIQTHRKEMDKQKQKYENYDDQIEEAVHDLTVIDQNRAELQVKVEQQQSRVSKLQQDVDACTSVDDLRATYEQAKINQNALRPEYQSKKRDCQELQREVEAVKQEIESERRKLDNLQDTTIQRQRAVFRWAPEVKQAYDWIQGHRDMFRHPVVGPIAAEVSPKSNNAAAYLEQHVPNSTLKSFVVQSKADYDLLYQKIRVEQNIPINIIQVERSNGAKRRMYSDVMMDMLKRDHGIIGYLDEAIVAPPTVLEALKSSASIDKVLIGTDTTQDSMDNRGLGGILTEPEHPGGVLRGYCIFTSHRGRSFKYTSHISKYSNKPSLRVDDVRPPKVLLLGASEDAEQRVMKELQEREMQLAGLQPRLDEARGVMDEVCAQTQQAQQFVMDTQSNLRAAESLKKKLQVAQQKLHETESLLSVDDKQEKQEKIDKVNQRIRLSVKALNNHSETYKKLMLTTVRASGARLNKEAATVEERAAGEKSKEGEAGLKEIAAKYKEVQHHYKEKRNELKKLVIEARNEAPLQDAEGNETPLKAQLEELAEFETIEQAEVALEEAEDQINKVVADPGVFRQYEKKKQEVQAVRDDVEALTSRKEQRKSALESQQEPWEEALKAIISKVDQRFSKYMKELGCVGEVSLTKGNAGADNEEPSFKDYGVEIRVSFREGVKPSVLSARVQSGGERSVSTIMYLMAMQDMMVAPFRCVDEINQGLDERNERLVFRRIVKNSTKPPGPKGPTDHVGQYWLITPKLLPNLTDMEVEPMNVICIFNGPYNLKNPQDWMTERLISIRKRHAADREAADVEGSPQATLKSKRSKNSET